MALHTITDRLKYLVSSGLDSRVYGLTGIINTAVAIFRGKNYLRLRWKVSHIYMGVALNRIITVLANIQLFPQALQASCTLVEQTSQYMAHVSLSMDNTQCATEVVNAIQDGDSGSVSGGSSSTLLVVVMVWMCVAITIQLCGVSLLSILK